MVYYLGGSVGLSVSKTSTQTEFWGRMPPSQSQAGDSVRVLVTGYVPWMRTTRKVSVWPVGLVGGRRYERPVVENGKVVGWYTGWRADRPFAIDMAGFAVSLQVILSHPKAVFKRRGSQPGMQESDFLKQITTVEELEPKANNCTKVLVWHTRTEKVNLANEPKYHLDTVSIEV
ncbi:PREDICTED: galactosylgalactosylxylosylprotein 3-beta-glucuronosyltransferase 2 [Haliaeetus leucocephalus]|uniref:galactosylgalactosylxylosylprotein 3-beta-glucuronosyltransferase 2 n=1 Tax=Haliaeetus leucocephalus TaxID=52644 RepID=UPI00053CC34F|nr:PREDICTED: galactosylgalactosylxylosylprotein 3-beta-glucuronosyltransferase 2 [Haliaeetus leucocephalus]